MHFNEVTVFYFVCKSTLYVLSRAVREVGCIIETLLKFSARIQGLFTLTVREVFTLADYCTDDVN